MTQETIEERLARLAQTRERKERWARLTSDPDLLEHVCAHIASGGTHIDLAETWDIPFGWLSNWLRQDPERNKRLIHALNDRGEWGDEQILRELRRLGLSDIRKIFDENGNIKDPKDWPNEIAAAVASVEVFEEYSKGRNPEYIGQTKKVKFWDKRGSLELLGKNRRLFADKVEHTHTLKLEDLVAGSIEEEKKT